MHPGPRIAKKTPLSLSNRLVDLTEGYNARCRASEDRPPPWRPWRKSDESLSLEELEDLPHHDRVGLKGFFAMASEVVPSSPAAVSDETHDVDSTRHTTIRGHK